MDDEKIQKLSHLEWSIRSRTRNQQCALRLLRLFHEHKDQWVTKNWALAAQELLAVSFSLWRAAFLAEKTSKRSEVFSDATDFLERVIEDNAITYVQDKSCNEWTFNYYSRNARAALEALHKNWPEQVPEYVSVIRKPKDRWEYCQGLLDKAVSGFEELATKMRSQANVAIEKKEARKATKAKRRIVRRMTFENRKMKGSEENSISK